MAGEGWVKPGWVKAGWVRAVAAVLERIRSAEGATDTLQSASASGAILRTSTTASEQMRESDTK